MLGIYIHIPFCKQRCSYCDFYSQTDFSLKKDFVNSLCNEIAARKNYLENDVIRTVYFGGGTPSLLQEDDFRQIFSTLFSNFDLSHCEEITLEANPDDFAHNYTQLIRKYPFNRLSIGVQSFENDDLLLINRRHTALQAVEAVRNCQKAGFDNISIDLMYGLPNQTPQKWLKTLQQAIDLRVQHISAYHLTYEENTPIYQQRENGKITPVSEDASIELFELITKTLSENGFQHYEISNFALPGYESKHNSAYWQGKKYLGLGPSAHSFNGTSRQWNAANITEYIRGNRIAEIEILSEQDKINEFIITRLRTLKGINIDEFTELFGRASAQNLLLQSQPHIAQHNLLVENNYLHLTSNGIFISDGIMRDLLQ